MRLPTKIGIDSEGYILNQTAKENIQQEFRPVLNAAISLLKMSLDGNLHSIYIYGSVGRGEAKQGISDLDLNVIVYSFPSTKEKNQLLADTERLVEQYKSAIKVDYSFVQLEEAVSLENKYEWGFWLRHMCSCLHGEDLSKQFERMKPNEKISAALNGNIEQLMGQFRQELQQDQPASKQRKRSMLKRIIRGAYLKINVLDESWSTESGENLNILMHYFPKDPLFQEIRRLQLCEEEISSSELISLIDQFRGWLMASGGMNAL
ncbi:nucleotidyltransferase domain-containing protein [Cytobacillus purgationiresistens]|uniref:Nucleotidyltransferase n=1 Tax=Cytobacillus purgationiresistens TaxID=863449 RepID=A0ABU0AJH8_9BACI|nr:nucleotidyltransferase domain-containing protein [Cytobacillus purgationiresistens]MDQ0271426.1 putative nucleotidyltransferase [Cytobacillus purgationiresistens]